jgi:large subunit ribosomal protein L13
LRLAGDGSPYLIEGKVGRAVPGEPESCRSNARKKPYPWELTSWSGFLYVCRSFVGKDLDMKSFVAKDPGPNRTWLLVDVADLPLGRVAVKIADALRGKDKPTYTPHVDTGDFVVVINAEKVKLTGNKDDQKIYKRFSGWRGGLKETKASVVRERHPDRMIRQAVRGMMPKNTLNRKAISRLKVYAGAEHPHEAQNPQMVEWF